MKLLITIVVGVLVGAWIGFELALRSYSLLFDPIVKAENTQHGAVDELNNNAVMKLQDTGSVQ